MTIGVVGAGVMGAGVAQALAEAGHTVVLVDVSDAALEHCREEVRKGVAMAKLLRRGDTPPDADAVLARIDATTDYGDLAHVGFVIENTTESVELKEEVYARLDGVCPPATVFAANTSAIPIARLAAATHRGDRVLGMHFMNPVPLKPTVEVIRGEHTSDDTIAVALELLASMGKDGIVVRDSPGFVSNRVLMLTVNEAVGVLEDGVASAKDIDHIFTTCFGHKMGPLETADLIGLDTILNTLVVLQDAYGDKYRPAPMLEKLVADGHLGRKTGQGLHAYGRARTG